MSYSTSFDQLLTAAASNPVEANRFEARNAKGTQTKVIQNGKVLEGFHHRPTGFGIWDTKNNYFVLVTDGETFDTWKKKSVAADVANQFNLLGATCGNDNLKPWVLL